MLYKICQEKLPDSRVSIFTPEFNLFIMFIYCIIHPSLIPNSSVVEKTITFKKTFVTPSQVWNGWFT